MSASASVGMMQGDHPEAKAGSGAGAGTVAGASVVPRNIAAEIATKGYCLVPGLFDKDEIARMAGTVRGFLSTRGERFGLGRTQPNAAVEVPGISWLFGLPKVVSAFQAALDTQDIVFTGHCDIHRNMLSGWHKDSGETVPGGYFKGDYFAADDCRVYKMAIYLQDHPKDHTGMTVREGSHRTRELHYGPEQQLETRAGDALIFDVRLSHTGQLPDRIERLIHLGSMAAKQRQRSRPDPWLFTAAKEAYWKLMGRKEKMSIFFTYGAPNQYTEDFARGNMRRQLDQQGATMRGDVGALIGALKPAHVRLSQALGELGAKSGSVPV